MAEIEELLGGGGGGTHSHSSKGGKNKTLLFVGLGVAAGLIGLAIKSATGQNSQSEDVLTSADAESKDQAVSALGSQMQAFAQSMQQQNDTITAQLEKSNTAYENLAEDFADYKDTSEDKYLALQTSAEAMRNSLANQIEDLTDELDDTKSSIKKISASSKTTTSVKTSGGSSSGSSSDGTIHLANGNTVKYDNGPSGWTERDSKGNTVAAGVAPTYKSRM